MNRSKTIVSFSQSSRGIALNNSVAVYLMARQLIMANFFKISVALFKQEHPILFPYISPQIKRHAWKMHAALFCRGRGEICGQLQSQIIISRQDHCRAPEDTARFLQRSSLCGYAWVYIGRTCDTQTVLSSCLYMEYLE